MSIEFGREAKMVMNHFVEQWAWLFDSMRADAEQVAETFRQLADALTAAPGGEA